MAGFVGTRQISALVIKYWQHDLSCPVFRAHVPYLCTSAGGLWPQATNTLVLLNSVLI